MQKAPFGTVAYQCGHTWRAQLLQNWEGQGGSSSSEGSRRELGAVRGGIPGGKSLRLIWLDFPLSERSQGERKPRAGSEKR